MLAYLGLCVSVLSVTAMETLLTPHRRAGHNTLTVSTVLQELSPACLK